MTHESIRSPAAAPHLAPRRNADYRWTGRKALAFLDAIAAGESAAAAARAVGMSRQSAYRLRARVGGEFAHGWSLALRAGRERRLRERLARGAR